MTGTPAFDEGILSGGLIDDPLKPHPKADISMCLTWGDFKTLT